MPVPSVPRPVFVSYAHEDNEDADPKKRWLDRILTHLKPLEFAGQLTLCSDRHIGIGDDWHEHIQAHLNGARVAVLLISSNFMASAYIRNNELPVLLRRARQQGTKILPVLVGPSLFATARFKYADSKTGPREFTLASLQTAASPEKTLIEMNEGEQERTLLGVALRIQDIVQDSSQDSEHAHGRSQDVEGGGSHFAVPSQGPSVDIPPKEPPQHRNRGPDSQFLDRLRVEIKDVLERHRSLSAVLQAKAGDAFPADQRDIVAILCEERPEVAIDDVLRPATKACLSRLDAQSDEFRTTWEAAKQILCRICPFAVRGEWIARQEQKVAGSIEFRIMVRTPTGVEVAAARFHQVAASFRSEPGKSEVRGQGAIRTPRFEPGWGLEAAVMVILLEIWNRVFPLDERRTLTQDDLALLNAQLLDVVKHGEGQYYISVQTGDPTPLNQPEVYSRLMEKLPAVTVIYFHSAEGDSALIVDSEVRFVTAIRGFLGIPDSLTAGR